MHDAFQSTPENGARAGYAGGKRNEQIERQVAIDTVGHLMVLKGTAIEEKEPA